MVTQDIARTDDHGLSGVFEFDEVSDTGDLRRLAKGKIAIWRDSKPGFHRAGLIQLKNRPVRGEFRPMRPRRF
jgi:hypothetical protein